MLPDFSKHPFFTRWTDPQTGVESFILTERVAPLQRGFYHRIPSLSADGRYLWFTATFPPSREWVLAAADLKSSPPRLRAFPATAGHGGAMLLPSGDAAYLMLYDRVLRQPFDGPLEEVVRLPASLIGGRYLYNLGTQLTVSADGRRFVLDPHIGNRWLIATAEIATGEVTPLRWFSMGHHHAQFSPVDPELILVAQSQWVDPATGDKSEMNVRIWFMDTRLTRYEPVIGGLWFNHNSRSCHEWWAPDGKVAWCDYDDGVYECDLADRKQVLVWPHGVCHAHCDPAKRFYCADEDPYHWSAERPCRIFFFDRQTGQEVAIASGLPPPQHHPGDWRAYHTDPHPHFSVAGDAVIYTTTALGAINVAVAPVEGIRQRMRAG